MTESLYKPASFFLLRTPVWSIEDYERILSSTNWVQSIHQLYAEEELLREAVLIASPSLYSLLKSGVEKNTEEAANSLLNYIARMSTRPTPFGLFAAVALGSWREETHLVFDHKSLERKARPDMEWVFSIIENLYHRDNPFLNSLPVTVNPLNQRIGNRYFLSYLNQVSGEEEIMRQSISIRANQLTDSICTFAKKPITIAALWDKLKIKLPILEKELTEEVILALLKQQILMPALLPSLLSNSPFDDFCSLSPDRNSHFSLLEKIKDYQNSALGDGEAILSQLQSEMMDKSDTKKTIMVDTALKTDSFYLSPKVSQEVAKSLDLLWQISEVSSSSRPILSYHSRFLDRFGTHRTISILDLISDNKGLGPLDRELEKEYHPSIFAEKWEKWLHQKWQLAVHQNQQEIVLLEEEIQEFLRQSGKKSTDPCRAPLSVDVFGKVIAKSQEEIDRGEFLFLFSQQTWQGGATLGRFLDILGEKAREGLQQFLFEEEMLEKNVEFAEFSYWPARVRMANVAIHSPLRKNQLDFQNFLSLDLKDLFVGATNERLYLTDQVGKKEFVFCSGNMLNPALAPPELQLIQEISLSRYQLFYPFSFESIQKKAIFLPRVRYGKTILSPAQWFLDSDWIGRRSDSNISSEFESWAKTWNLPDRFLLVKYDQLLLIDRRHPGHLKEIERKLRRGESLRFYEELPQTWFKSSRGPHVAEIVIPFIKNARLAKKKPELTPVNRLAIPVQKRWKLPGSEWVSIKFYMNGEIDYFLVSHLKAFMEFLSTQISLIGWFFIRYADPEHHVRLRIKLDSADLLPQFFSYFEKEVLSWIEMGLIRQMSIDGYEREIERYKGEEFIDLAERLFFQDSISVVSVLEAKINKIIECQETVLHAASIFSFLSEFRLEFFEMQVILGFDSADKSALKSFRKYRSQLIEMIDQCSSKGYCLAHEEFLKAASNLSREDLFDLYNSLVHMHCNRLGCHGEAEISARAYLYNTLKYLKNRQEASHA